MQITKLRKGAIVSYHPAESGTPDVIKFQYNPQKITRTLTASFADSNNVGKNALKLNGAPNESIDVDIEIDGADLYSGDVASYGINPQLSALEILLYPKSKDIKKKKQKVASGKMDISPVQGAYVLFVWGKDRIVPVEIETMTITEEQFDAKLNTVRATVALKLKVLSYNNFLSGHKGYEQFLSYQSAKEQMAKSAVSHDLDDEFGEMNL